MSGSRIVLVLKHCLNLLTGPGNIYVRSNFKLMRLGIVVFYPLFLALLIALIQKTYIPAMTFYPIFVLLTFGLWYFTGFLLSVFLSFTFLIIATLISPISFIWTFALWMTFFWLGSVWTMGLQSLLQKEKVQQQFHREIKTKNDLTYQLFSNLSHELRNPLSVITGFTEVLIPWARKQGAPQESYYLKMIKKSATTLLNVLNSILEFTKIESEHFTSQKSFINLHSLLSHLEYTFREKAQEKDLRFSFHIDKSVKEELFIDEQALSQILTQVIDNAIKFTEKGSVSIFSVLHKGQKTNGNYQDILCLTIKDTGVGINESEKDKLLQPFFQMGKGLTKSGGGLGLGLPISNRLIHKIGGTMKIESDINGTNILLEIPTLVGAEAEVSSDQETDNTLTLLSGKNQEKILIVEDLKDNRYLLKRLLKTMHFEVIEAENGRDAIDILTKSKQRNAISAVFMDMQMPILNGYKATKILRRKGLELPIIALTAKNLQEDKELCFKSGCNDYLPKPFELNQLQKIVGKIVRHQY